MLLFVVNSELTYRQHRIDYRICAAYIMFIVYCLWGTAEHRLSGAIVSCCDDDDDDGNRNEYSTKNAQIIYVHFKKFNLKAKI